MTTTLPPDRGLAGSSTPETPYLTTVSLAELLSEVELLPAGRKRSKLQAALTEHPLPLFNERILSFDTQAASHHAHIHEHMRASGRDFKGTGVEVLNPWE